MSNVGSQTGGFNPPQLPNRTERSSSTIRRTAPAHITTTEKKSEKENIPIEKEVFTSREEIQKIQKDVSKDRSSVDSFKQRENAEGKSNSKEISSQAALKHFDEKKTQESKSKNFAQNIQNSELSLVKQGKEKSEIAKSQDETLTSTAVQSANVEETKPDSKKNKQLNDKLEIFQLGGDKGKGFVAFVKREMSKGELSESIVDLVEGYFKTLKGKSLTVSEMITAGEEPLITIRSMVSSANKDEQIAIQDSLSKSISSSAGERADLMVVRNLDKPTIKSAPPKPEISVKASKIEKATEFVSSINFGSLSAPWDKALLAA
jgi:hypothetical protein